MEYCEVPSQIKFDANQITLDQNRVKSNFTDYMAETFGRWLEQKRDAAGLNQTELAKLSRVSKNTISLYEQDKVAQPRLKQLDKIALALGLSKQEVRRAAGLSHQSDDPITQAVIDATRTLPKNENYTDDEIREFQEEMYDQARLKLERILARRKPLTNE